MHPVSTPLPVDFVLLTLFCFYSINNKSPAASLCSDLHSEISTAAAAAAISINIRINSADQACLSGKHDVINISLYFIKLCLKFCCRLSVSVYSTIAQGLFFLF